MKDATINTKILKKSNRGTIALSIQISSIFCPFSDYIKFLESIVENRLSPTLNIEGEGPYASMAWNNISACDAGILTIQGCSGSIFHRRSFDHSIRLNTKQFVRMLYASLRNFVESNHYQPMMYEKRSFGEECEFLLQDDSLTDMISLISNCDSNRAESILYLLRDSVSELITNKNARQSIDFFMRHSAPPAAVKLNFPWVHENWDTWDRENRLNFLHNKIFDTDGCLPWGGKQLKCLRSSLIENCLF